jgi:REP element-mobilizing transposase RayT
MSSIPQRQGGIERKMGANLPHWRQDFATYAVTFRQADSLPASVLNRWRQERDAHIKRAIDNNMPLGTDQLKRLAQLHTDRIQDYLDRGEGSCVFRQPRFADLMQNALRHFERQRYDLLAWCVMPNHVHVVFTPYPPHELGQILKSWRGYTALEINRALGKSGHFWQPEPYDHIVRDSADLHHQVRYVLNNPVKAGLSNWTWLGCADWLRGIAL